MDSNFSHVLIGSRNLEYPWIFTVLQTERKMACRFAKVSEEEIEEAFFYPSDLVNTKTLSSSGSVKNGGYIPWRFVSRYISTTNSPPLWVIVVYYPNWMSHCPLHNSNTFAGCTCLIYSLYHSTFEWLGPGLLVKHLPHAKILQTLTSYLWLKNALMT